MHSGAEHETPAKKAHKYISAEGTTEFCHPVGVLKLSCLFYRGSFSATLRKRLLRRRASLRSPSVARGVLAPLIRHGWPSGHPLKAFFATCLHYGQPFGLSVTPCASSYNSFRMAADGYFTFTVRRWSWLSALLPPTMSSWRPGTTRMVLVFTSQPSKRSRGRSMTTCRVSPGASCTRW